MTARPLPRSASLFIELVELSVLRVLGPVASRTPTKFRVDRAATPTSWTTVATLQAFRGSRIRYQTHELRYVFPERGQLPAVGVERVMEFGEIQKP